jgi:Mrp family chromosome partitioning ATPase
MSRHAAILQTSLDIVEQFDNRAPMGLPHAAPAPSDDYGRLIAALFSGAEPLKVVAFTSASPQEGVTYTVTHVATELERRTNRRVGVVSAQELQSKSADVQPAWLLGGGEGRRRGSTDHVATLQTRYDIVLIDAGCIAEGAIIGRGVEAVVIVVEAGRTTKRDLHRTITAIRTGQARVVGLVLNKYKRVLPAWLERLFGSQT